MDIWPTVLLLVGLIVGALVASLVLRSRHKTQIEAAVLEVQSHLQSQLATLTERASHIPDLEEELLSAERERDTARQTAGDLAEQKASLQTTANRVPGLETEVEELRGDLSSANKALADLRESLGRENAQLQEQVKAAQDNLTESEEALTSEQEARTGADKEVHRLSAEVRALQDRLSTETKTAEQEAAFINDAGVALINQFEVLANRILDEKSQKFTALNKTNLDGVLVPLQTKLDEFKTTVQKAYTDEGKERFALTKQVEQLVALNAALSEDAKNLTSALKGSSKSQGTWGELILERVLEAAGLRKGEEYIAQERQQAEDGKWLQPDVVICLPEERHLVVDSKVSLVAYERFASATTDSERTVALKQHLDSVRGHMKGLAEKNYQTRYGLQSLDFVLLFVPIEPAFMLAVTNDNALFMDAWRRNVLLVSPSTLLFVVRTVAHLWRQEAQSRHAQEIANRGAELYDKLVGFVADLQQIGKELKSAQAAYEAAENKLCTGKGNTIRQAELLRELGVKPTKRLPHQLVERALPVDALSLLPEADCTDSALATPEGQAQVEAVPETPL